MTAAVTHTEESKEGYTPNIQNAELVLALDVYCAVLQTSNSIEASTVIHDLCAFRTNLMDQETISLYQEGFTNLVPYMKQMTFDDVVAYVLHGKTYDANRDHPTRNNTWEGLDARQVAKLQVLEGYGIRVRND